MNVTLEPFSFGREDKKWLKKLFLSAFPRVERPPFWVFVRMRPPKAALWLIRADRQKAGFFSVLPGRGLAYVYLFAVDDALRGRGIGSSALRQLCSLYEGKLFLAIEPLMPEAPNYFVRVRRKAFYERNGFTYLHQWIRESGETYSLLGIGEPVPEKGYLSLMRSGLGLLAFRIVRPAIGPGDAEALLRP